MRLRRALVVWLIDFLLLTSGLAEVRVKNELPTVGEVIDRSLERAEWSRDQNWEATYTFTLVTVREKLNRDNTVDKRQERVYKNLPIAGIPYPRLVEKNGQSLNRVELEEEKKKEREFRQKLERGKYPRPGNENSVAFNEDLVGRYNAELSGIEEIHGRSAYVLSFSPKEGDLPVRRRIDRALNKAEGTIWIGTENYQIFRVEFELKQKVRMWWGLLGSLSEVKGRLDRTEVDDGVWLPSRFDLYVKGRALFRSLHFKSAVRWHGFKKFLE